MNIVKYTGTYKKEICGNYGIFNINTMFQSALSSYNITLILNTPSGYRILVGAGLSAPVKPGPGTHPASCTMGTGSFPEVKCGQGVLLTTTPPSSAEVMEE
jgi:hypothetical protein